MEIRLVDNHRGPPAILQPALRNYKHHSTNLQNLHIGLSRGLRFARQQTPAQVAQCVMVCVCERVSADTHSLSVAFREAPTAEISVGSDNVRDGGR